MSVRSNLERLLMALPAIIIHSVVNTLITSTVAGVILIQFVAAGHKYIGFGAALLSAVVVYTWLVFNHKLRNYIKSLEPRDE